MSNGETVAYEMLDDFEKEVDQALAVHNLRKADRTILRGQKLMVLFIRAQKPTAEKIAEDKRICDEHNTMWRTYQTGYRLLWAAITSSIGSTAAWIWAAVRMATVAK